MRLLIAALAALWMMAPASAAQHSDDRYFDSRAPIVQKNVRPNVRQAKPRKVQTVRHRARKSVTKSVLAPRLKYRRTAWRASTAAAPVVADVQSVVPAGPRPRAWCGWFMGKLHGLLDRKLWLARNWAHVGAPATKQPGVIVVWKHHVGKITAVRADGAIKVLSGNDGRAVRDRWRSARGVIAYRAL